MKVIIKIDELEIKGALIEGLEISQTMSEAEVIEYSRKDRSQLLEEILVSMEKMAGITKEENNEGVEKND